MHYEEDFLKTPQNKEIPYRAWRSKKPDATLLVIHGMAEHSGRYEGLGNFLTEKNISLYAFDLTGHGEQCPEHQLGHIENWQTNIDDIHFMWGQVAEFEPRIPLFILGHSMGSYLTLEALQAQQPYPLSGIILSGSGLHPSIQLWAGKQVARIEKLRQGKQGYSNLLEQLSFGSFNKAFEPAKTEMDWLSRDLQSVLNYIEDPYCGFQCSNQFWIEFLNAQLRINKSSGLSNLPRVPILMISGDKDPVGRMGKGAAQLEKRLRSNMETAIQFNLYPNGRHEMLNERNRVAVMTDIYQWVTQECKRIIPEL